MWDKEHLLRLSGSPQAPGVHIYDTATRQEHIGAYIPCLAGGVAIYYGPEDRRIVVSWQQVLDALNLSRPLTV